MTTVSNSIPSPLFKHYFLSDTYWFDIVELSGDFFNWVVSDEAKFLNGKFIAANWDAEELLQRKDEITGDRHIYTMGLIGWREAHALDPSKLKDTSK